MAGLLGLVRMRAAIYRRIRHFGQDSINNSMSRRSRGANRLFRCERTEEEVALVCERASGRTKAPNLAEIPSPASLSRDCAPRRSFNGGHYAAAVHQLTASRASPPGRERVYILHTRITRRGGRGEERGGVGREERSLPVSRRGILAGESRGRNDTRPVRYRYIDVARCKIHGGRTSPVIPRVFFG